MVQLYVLFDEKLYPVRDIEEDKVIEFLIHLFEKVPESYTITKIDDTTVMYEVSLDKEKRIFYCINKP